MLFDMVFMYVLKKVVSKTDEVFWKLDYQAGLSWYCGFINF